MLLARSAPELPQVARRSAILLSEMSTARGARMRLLGATAVTLTLALATSAASAERPRYDVPPGFVRCPHAQALNGFFKWASVRRTTCRAAARFMHAYGAREAATGKMPRALRGYRCAIRYWRNADGDIYASRHVCRRPDVTLRFYGMV
jgi:hypothetical protein